MGRLGKCLALVWLACQLLCPANGQAAVEVINSSAYKKILNYLLIRPADVKLYRKIFADLAEADFDSAEDHTAQLENNIILGHVLAEKYLHPDYSSSYEELRQWLAEYADLPQAARIYRLAGQKGGFSGLPAPHQAAEATRIPGWSEQYLTKRSASERIYLQKQVKAFNRALNSGKTKKARLVLEQPRFRRLAPDRYWDEMAASLAMKYLVDNYISLAAQWAEKASRRGTSAMAPWVAGMAAWQKKDYRRAAKYFDRLAASQTKDEWLKSAGGYWAFRAYTRLKKPAEANRALHRAAKYRHTFYGILAAGRLRLPPKYEWDAAAYLNDFSGKEYIYDLVASPAIRRAVILLHAGRTDLAESELRHAFSQMTPKQQEATIFIADQYKMHSLGVFACKQALKSSPSLKYYPIAFPVPEWFTRGRREADKALVLALARQESSFNADARSPAGARGLMQLMPNTAFHITGDRSIRRNAERLMQADYNLNLGRRYVEYLLSKPFIDGNLFYMTAAYNAGPTNLVRWQKTTRYNDDPLAFIELIPSAQTRIYIERVIANYWIYNFRFGLENPTLKQAAAGKWPTLSPRR